MISPGRLEAADSQPLGNRQQYCSPSMSHSAQKAYHVATEIAAMISNTPPAGFDTLRPSAPLPSAPPPSSGRGTIPGAPSEVVNLPPPGFPDFFFATPFFGILENLRRKKQNLPREMKE